MPKTIINSSTPAAPADARNLKWQTQGTDPIYASGYMPKAKVAGELGLVQLPDPLDANVVLKGDGTFGALSEVPGSGADLQTNGVDNALQSLLNLIAGDYIILTADEAGGVTIAGVPASIYVSAADVPPSVPNAMDDEFAAGSLDAKWTWVNQGTATAALADGRLTLTGQASGAYLLRGIFQNMPASPCSFAAKISLQGNMVRAFTGLCARSSAPASRLWGPIYGSSGYANRVDLWSSDSAYGSAAFVLANFWNTLYYKIRRDTDTSLQFYLSMDGITWSLVAAVSGFTAAQIGLVVMTDAAAGSGNNPVMVVDWFRRLE